MALSLVAWLLTWYYINKDTSHVGLGAHPILIWPCINLTHYIYNNYSSNKVTLGGPGGEAYNMKTLVDTIQCITVS